MPQYSARVCYIHGGPLLRLAGTFLHPATSPNRLGDGVYTQLHIGGMEEIGRRNERKSEKLYSFLDQSKLYAVPVVKEFRSRMNVDFRVRAKSGDGSR